VEAHALCRASLIRQRTVPHCTFQVRSVQVQEGEIYMAHIELPIAPELGREFPGILGLMTFRPDTATPINELVNILLRVIAS
jgi:hypothetical protein